jgi:acyl-homoserine lactone acylase PvdQ
VLRASRLSTKADPIKALEQSYLRTKNANHQEFQKMMEIRTNSSNNTVYADADGILVSQQALPIS